MYYVKERDRVKKKRVRKFLTLLLAAAMVLGGISMPKAAMKAEAAPAYRNVVYYGDWSIYSGQKYFYPSKIDGSLITHLNLKLFLLLLKIMISLALSEEY